MAGYRDEDEALHQRMQNLEDDLRVAKEELAGKADDEERAKKIAAMEKQMADARRQLDLLGAELGQMRGKPPPRKLARNVAIGGVAAAALVGGLVVATRSGPAHVPAPLSPATHPVAPAPTPSAVVVTPPIVPHPHPTAGESSAPDEKRVKTVQWQGKVTRVTSSTIAVGAPCTLQGQVTTNGTYVDLEHVEVTCGGHALYRSDDSFNGTSENESHVVELPQPAGGQSYAVALHDQGSRSGRSQISLDSTKSAGAVWVDGMPAWRVEFSLPTTSQPDSEPALFDASRRAIRSVLTVDKIDGTGAPVRAHDRCSMVTWVIPGPGGQCEVHVLCGAKVLYGGPGLGVTSCTQSEGVVTTARDDKPSSQGPDPAIAVDIGAGTVDVTDDPHDKPWTVHLRVTPPSK